MEKNIQQLTLLSQINKDFGVGSVDIRTYSLLTLAYIGDAVFELVIRTVIVENGQQSVNKLHKNTSKIVCAGTQAKMIEAVYERLTKEEQDMYRRGKNAKTNSSAKNASLSDYHKATGLEALCGYLYLKHDEARLIQIIRQAFEEMKNEQ